MSGAEFVSALASTTASTSCSQKNLPRSPNPTWTTPAATPPTVIAAHPPFQTLIRTPPPPWIEEDADSTNFFDCPDNYSASYCLMTPLLHPPRTNHDDHYNTPPMLDVTNQSSPDIYGNGD